MPEEELMRYTLKDKLRALGVGAADEVITTANTFIATAEAISMTGAKPVFVDVDPKTYTMDPAKLEQAITARTRIIIPVHLFGQSAEVAVLHQPPQEIADLIAFKMRVALGDTLRKYLRGAQIR